ncbi:uncharacterized protein [Clytia hemisphaerica]|uniref:Uncharacterized protein n=1 Tax=Clytia hemisphaerica TaxID=252671 RepID=A0A7M5TYZ0_9CNID|eukprot:TCONS_00054367-protein
MEDLSEDEFDDYDGKNADSQFDLTYKAIVIGESQVGKTALVKRYKNPNSKLPNLLPTIGIDFRAVDKVIDGLKIRVQLWDTAGQERFRTMTKSFFRGARGVLLLYDVTERKSFLRVEEWVRNIKDFDLDKEEVFLIGNKIDLDFREITYEEGKSLANQYGFKYFETSALTGENVESTIDKLVYNMKDSSNPFQKGNICVVNGQEWEQVSSKDVRNDTVRLNHHKQQQQKHNQKTGGGSCGCG